MEPSCAEIRKKLTAWPDLSEDERRAARGHASTCGECALAIEETERVFDLLSDASASFRKARFEGGPPRFPRPAGRRTRGRRWLLASAAVAAALLALVSVRIVQRGAQIPAAGAPEPSPTPSLSAAMTLRKSSSRLPARPSFSAVSLASVRAQSLRIPRSSAPPPGRGVSLRVPPRPVPEGRDRSRR